MVFGMLRFFKGLGNANFLTVLIVKSFAIICPFRSRLLPGLIFSLEFCFVNPLTVIRTLNECFLVMNCFNLLAVNRNS